MGLCGGINEFAHASVMSCDSARWADLYSNVVLVGGSMCFPGIADRLLKELTALAPAAITKQGAAAIKIVAPPVEERRYLVWIGGSMVAALSSFQQTAIKQEEYDEQGPGIIHTKCPW